MRRSTTLRRTIAAALALATLGGPGFAEGAESGKNAEKKTQKKRDGTKTSEKKGEATDAKNPKKRTSNNESADEAGEPAEDEPPAEFERLMEKGRAAYNEEQWMSAAHAYLNAAQVAPDRAYAYRNLARSYFMAEEYARAAAFYDYYLELAPDSAKTDRIERERKLAAHRAGDRVWTRPDSQKRVLAALRDALNDGEAYTKGGGGAWALYKALLRTGYVHPDLAHLKVRLRDKLIAEFDARIEPESGRPTPVLSLRDWQRQQRRLEAARSVTHDSGARSEIDGRMRIVDTAIAVINGRYDDAADLARDARRANPDVAFLTWFELTALIGAERYDAAEERIAALRDADSKLSERRAEYLRALEAIVAHRRNDYDSAAALYRKVLK